LPSHRSSFLSHVSSNPRKTKLKRISRNILDKCHNSRVRKETLTLSKKMRTTVISYDGKRITVALNFTKQP
jgi:hypothetical protein